MRGGGCRVGRGSWPWIGEQCGSCYDARVTEAAANPVDARAREERAKGHYGYSAWDRLPLTYPGMTTQLEFEPIEFEAIRFEHRVRDYVSAAAARPSPGGTDSAAPVTEHRSRTAAWTVALASPNVQDRLDKWMSRRAQTALVAVLAVSGMMFMLASSRSMPWSEMLALGAVLLIPIGIGAVIGLAYRRRLASRSRDSGFMSIARSFGERRCPDCGYDLHGLIPAIEPSRVEGLDVGPMQCPECRSKWPLVPPPARFAPAPRKGRREA